MKVVLAWLAMSLPSALALQSVAKVGINGNTPKPVVDKIVFIKLHHVGSSTMTGILHHYCELHQKICFVEPTDIPGYVWRADGLRNLSSTFRSSSLPTLDVFPNHEVMEEALLDTLVPGNFKFSVFRNPIDRLMSGLRFKLDSHEVLHILDRLQQNLHSYYCGLKGMSAQVTAEQVDDLDFVMLTEEYDTSLMMLRRALGWSMFDVMYRRLKDHRDGETYNATVALQEYISRPVDSLNEATRAYLQACAGQNETSVYQAAKSRYQTQWEQLAEWEQKETLEDLATFHAAKEVLESCCESNPSDSYCVGMLEDNSEWNLRYRRQGYSYTSIRANGSTPESNVAQESACSSMVKVALGSS